MKNLGRSLFKPRTHLGLIYEGDRVTLASFRKIGDAWVTRGRTYFSAQTGKIQNNATSKAFLDLDSLSPIQAHMED